MTLPDPAKARAYLAAYKAWDETSANDPRLEAIAAPYFAAKDTWHKEFDTGLFGDEFEGIVRRLP